MLKLYIKFLKSPLRLLYISLLISISLSAQNKRYEGRNKLKNKKPISNVISQKGLSIFSGYNLSKINYNDNKINDQNDITSLIGSSIGIEYRFPKFIIGTTLIQRGSKLKQRTTTNIGGVDYGIEISGQEVYNYVAAHMYYPISLNERLQFFGGVQIGKSLGGESITKFSFIDYNSSQSDTINMKPKEFGLDTGLQFGLDYMLNNRLGLRTSYYLGMSDVRDTLSSNFNFKNQTVSLSAFIKLRGFKKKPSIKKPDSKINSKSRLLLPSRAIEVQIAGRAGSKTDTQSKIAIEYGLRDDISIGISNSNYLNTYDLFARTNYLNRLVDKFGYPINLIYNSIISAQMDKPEVIDKLDKLNFLNQLIIEYKIKSNIRLKLIPTYIHKNIAETKLKPKGYPWDIWFLETGVNWAFKDNIEIYGNIIEQMSDLDISQGSKSSIKFGLQYFIKTFILDISITDLYHLHGTSIIDDIGVNNYTENLRIGIQINKIFN